MPVVPGSKGEQIMRSESRAGLLATFLCLMMIGCSSYQPIENAELTTTSVDLEANNFKVRKVGVQGFASTPYLFGIPMGKSVIGIPLEPGNQALQADAMADLYSKWNGDGSIFLHNINKEWSHSCMPGIYIIHEHTVTADIYEFTDEYKTYRSR
jgi:hypothetical protein